MNRCEATQRQILALTDVDRAPPGVQAHLDGCPACRDWQSRVAQIDHAVPLVPVPPSLAKAALLQRLKSQPSRQQRFRVKAWQLTAAWSAAAVLLFVLLYHLAQAPAPLPPPGPGPTGAADPWLARLFEQHESLAQATTPRQQVETLAALADDVRDQTQSLVRFVEIGKLQRLAELYGQAVDVGVERAGDLPRDERRAVLEPIVRRLEEARVAADRQARADRVASADHPLVTIGNAARLGKDRLDHLLMDEAIMRGPDLRGHYVQSCVLAVLPPWAPLAIRAAATVRGDGGARASAESIHQFQRNHRLVEALVASSIELARKQDRIGRAAQCNPVVARLASEIMAAADRQDAARVVELTRHLRNLLRRVVAVNLARGGVDALPGSEREQQLLQAGGETLRRLTPLEDRLVLLTAPAYRGAFDDLRIGRKEVELALQGRGLR